METGESGGLDLGEAGGGGRGIKGPGEPSVSRGIKTSSQRRGEGGREEGNVAMHG